MKPSDVPFARSSGFEKPTSGAGGFESMAAAAAKKAAPEAAPTDAQLARVDDLFIRGALTPDQVAKAKASRGGFEAIIGRNNLLPAVFLEIGSATSRATCLIRTSGVDFLGRNGAWTGTGFLLSENVLVTNNHVLNSPEVAADGSAVFNYQLGQDGQPLPTRSFRLRPDRLFLTSAVRGGLDYTFVWVDGEPGREFGSVRVSRKAFAIAENEFANVISHPDGRMKEVSLQENEVQWQDVTVVHYTSDTEPGSSGASVCNNNWQLMALHHASKPSTIPNYPVLNEGIKLSAVAADLERLGAGPTGSATAREVLALFGGTDERLGFFGALGRRTAASGLEAVVDTYKGTERDIDVGFWNVEWLTSSYETKAAGVARVMREFNLDIWCLEESSPNAAAVVVAELKNLGLNFNALAAEPLSEDGKQSCTLLWNTETVACEEEKWGPPIEEWFQSRSKDFADLDLGFEAVHGKIFDRYPGLFKVTTVKFVNGTPYQFYVVPVHLKAMSEGSLRRRMASKILAAAVRKKIAGGAAADWIIGGDFNAELATNDFADLSAGGMVPASAEDEQGGAFSYIKGPQSLIDHIFLSPNLATRFGAKDYIIVAAERSFPDYVEDISDHRPVLFRMSMNGGSGPIAAGGPEAAKPKVVSPAVAELKKMLAAVAAHAVPGNGLEARRRRQPRPEDYENRQGYDQDFLGRGSHRVPVPQLPPALADKAVVVDRHASGMDRYLLAYTHFSLAMNGERRLAFFTAVNIDGNSLHQIKRAGDPWRLDPRIPEDVQIGGELYTNNDLDRGHMVRRLDPVWGSRSVAVHANEDTFHYTNSCPQHKDLNQKEWNDLEDYILDNAGAQELRVCVFTGPILRSTDRPYRELIPLPEDFWKVAVIIRDDTGRMSATGYILSQKDMLTDLEFAFGAFRTYQVSLRKIERLTRLDFGRLKECDPLNRGGMEAAGMAADGSAKLITGPRDLVF